MTTSTDVSKIKDYLGRNSADLLRLAYQGMEAWNQVTVLPDVKNKIRLTTLSIDKMVKPFSADFSPTENVIGFKPREIGVEVAKADLQVVPEEFRQTYLAQFTQTKGVMRTPQDLPFEKFIWEDVFAAFGEELNNDTAYLGVHNASGTSAKDVADGWGTILAANIYDDTENPDGVITPVTTGAITSDDAYEQLKTLVRSVEPKYRTPKWNLKAYMSYATYEAYLDNLDTLGVNTGRGNDPIGGANAKWLRGYQNIVELVPATWMGDSGRIILTPKANIILAADAVQQDLGKMNFVQDVWSFKVGIACAIGFDFRYLPLITCNEQV